MLPLVVLPLSLVILLAPVASCVHAASALAILGTFAFAIPAFTRRVFADSSVGRTSYTVAFPCVGQNTPPSSLALSFGTTFDACHGNTATTFDAPVHGDAAARAFPRRCSSSVFVYAALLPDGRYCQEVPLCIILARSLSRSFAVDPPLGFAFGTAAAAVAIILTLGSALSPALGLAASLTCPFCPTVALARALHSTRTPPQGKAAVSPGRSRYSLSWTSRFARAPHQLPLYLPSGSVSSCKASSAFGGPAKTSSTASSSAHCLAAGTICHGNAFPTGAITSCIPGQCPVGLDDLCQGHTQPIFQGRHIP
mmetsp:Transcript_125585/g.244726  ORF Transcript_125585/g.244726 Transcript_125585/m.244726 type:complete len:310 (-) Transcript_125585:67-996(-)